MSLLKDTTVRQALRLAWEQSNPGTPDAHEEGGFIVREWDGKLLTECWPRGDRDGIDVPAHPNGTYGGRTILASFHTHPNTGANYLQEPSLTDIRAVREDEDLHSPDYEGEYVISLEQVYLINPNGSVTEMGPTNVLLGL